MAIVHKLQVPDSAGTNVTHTLGTIHYIVGTGTTAGTWLGTDSSITEYYDGLVIAYKLNIAGASTTTLNLNGLGAKTVYRGGTTKLTTQYAVDSVVLLVYTTTSSTGCWQVADYDANTTYTPQKLGFGYGTCSTAAGTAAKAVTLADYVLVKNGFVAVKFSNAVTSSSSTMNINSKGAKAIYYNGAAIGTNVILAGDVCLFVYDGSYYHLLTIDRAFNGSGGITVDNATIKHSNSVTAGTAQGDATKTLSFGGTFTIPTVTYDAQGHITAKGTTTMTMPGNPNTNKSHKIISGTKADGTTNIVSASASSGDITLGDSGVTAGEYGPTANATPGYGSTFNVPDIKVNSKGIVTSVTNRTVKIPASDNTDTKNTTGSTNTDSKIFLVGATSQAANPQTYSHDTAYVGTDGHLYSNSAKVLSTTYAPEAYLQWGGKNFAGSWGPIDAAMVPNFAANRLAFFNKAYVTLEVSTNGGSTWTTVSDDTIKGGLFSTGTAFPLGNTSTTKVDKSKYMNRVTITTTNAQCYTVLNKFAIRITTNGSSGCYCTIDARTKANQDAGANTWVNFANKVDLAGWSGWNIINTSGITTHGNNTAHYSQIRFTFGVASHSSTSTYSGMQILRIMAFGGEGWSTCSNMATDGHLYSYDGSQNATFPAGLNTVGNLTENGTRVSNRNHTHSVSGTAASGGASTSTSTGSAGGGTADQATGSTTPTFTGSSATTSSAGGGTADQATGSTTPTFTGTGVELVFTGSSATSGSAGAGSSSTTGKNSGNGVSVVTGVAGNGTATALTGVKASSTDTFVKTVSGGSGSLTTDTTATGGIQYVESVSHTAASLTGTTTFNTDAIKSVSLSASTKSTDGPAYVSAVSGGSAVSKTTKYMKFSAGTTPPSSASFTGTAVTSGASSGSTGGSTVITGASVSNGMLTLTSSSHTHSLNSHTHSVTAAGTVGLTAGTAPSMNFNTGSSSDTPYISAVSGGSAVSVTTRYMKVTPTAASTGTVGISGGSISAATKYLHHTHTGASAGSTGSAVTGVAANGTATVLTGVKASGTTKVAPNEHTHSYTAPSAHTHTVTATGTIGVGTGTANYTPSGTVSGHTHTYTKPAAHTHTVTAKGSVGGHTHTYVKPAAHTHSYNAPANHTHTVSGTAAKES